MTTEPDPRDELDALFRAAELEPPNSERAELVLGFGLMRELVGLMRTVPIPDDCSPANGSSIVISWRE